MFGDNHVHMVLDGVYYKDAINRHRRGGDEQFVRATLTKYRDAGVTYLRDGVTVSEPVRWPHVWPRSME